MRSAYQFICLPLLLAACLPPELLEQQAAGGEQTAAVGAEALIGKWTASSNTGSAVEVGTLLTLDASGSYAYTSGNVNFALVQETGTYTVRGEELLLHRREGMLTRSGTREALPAETRAYRWFFGGTPNWAPIPGCRSGPACVDQNAGRILYLRRADGREEYYYRSQ